MITYSEGLKNEFRLNNLTRKIILSSNIILLPQE
jgi:hypothetical protein